MQSSVAKKMVAVHLTTIPRESYTAHYAKKSRIFAMFVLVLKTLHIIGLKMLEQFCMFL